MIRESNNPSPKERRAARPADLSVAVKAGDSDICRLDITFGEEILDTHQGHLIRPISENLHNFAGNADFTPASIFESLAPWNQNSSSTTQRQGRFSEDFP